MSRKRCRVKGGRCVWGEGEASGGGGVNVWGGERER